MTRSAGAMADTEVDTEVDPRFESFLTDATDPETPKEIQTQIRAGLARQYANPPVSQTERCLRQNLTPDRCRGLVYWRTRMTRRCTRRYSRIRRTARPRVTRSSGVR